MTYERDLQEIEIACNEVFGINVEVAPRALQVLMNSFKQVNVLRHNIALTSDLECFRNVLASSPAYTDAALRQNISLELASPLQGTTFRPRELPRLGNYKNLLSDIFVSQWPFRAGLHPAGVNVRTMGILTETDLLLGCLQAGRRSIFPNQTAKILLSTFGFDAEYPTPSADKFLSRIERQLKSGGSRGVRT